MLNNSRKGLEDRGESGDTFYAIKAYAAEYKPKIIILENVVSVPWTDAKAKNKERGLDVHFKEIGYACHHLILDTKHFYIPQTRQRGYLVAIHVESLDRTTAKFNTPIRSQLNKWAELVGEFKRPASVPAERFLLKSDDPKLKFSQIEDLDMNKTVISWDKCSVGHEIYRSANKLGHERPITNWYRG
jgi:site-specific DNA-cytosine methylase